MKITIVMTTYNGSEFIEEQLESLRIQSRVADEVLILDDSSTDCTVTMVQHFIKKNNLTSWRLIQNNTNLGWKRNFINGFDMATGDLIFPCDQDDVWHSDKLEIMEKIMAKHPEIDVLTGCANYIFTEQEVPVKSFTFRVSRFLDKHLRIRNHNHSGDIFKQEFDCHFKAVDQGCRMCFRKEFWETNKQFWFEELAHDRFLSFYSKLKESYYALDQDIIDYRYHIGSVTNIAKRNHNERVDKLIIDRKEIYSLLDNFDESIYAAEYRKIIQDAAKWNMYRIELVCNKKILAGIKLIPYLKYYPIKRHYLSDWMYAYNEN